MPQASVLSHFIFNTALADQQASLPAVTQLQTQCAIYNDAVALCVRRPMRYHPAVWSSLQRALDAVTTFLGNIDLTVSPTKMDALLIHPRASTRLSVHELNINGDSVPCKCRSLTWASPSNTEWRVSRLPRS